MQIFLCISKKSTIFATDMKLQSVIDHLKKPSRSIFQQLIRYGFSGAIAFVVDFGLLWFVTGVCHAHYLFGAFCGYTAGLIITYLLSITWIFSDRKLSNRQGAEFLIFTVIGLVGLLLTQGLMYLFTEYLFGIDRYLYSKMLTAVLVALFNFAMKKLLLFSQSHPSSPDTKNNR